MVAEVANGMRRSVVIISAVHDYRMGRRGSIQSIADALVRSDFDVKFVSIRFSLISLLKRDSRSFLWRRRNRPEPAGGVECFLWFTLIHPFDVRSRGLNWLLRPLFSIYGGLRCRYIDVATASASFVIIESGLGIVLAPRVRRLNPSARVIYRASDRLETIGAPAVLQAKLEQSSSLFDSYCLLSRKMASDFAWADGQAFSVPLGINADDYASIGATPYSGSLNAVSVGSMLFDETFFAIAAKRRPDITFHVIGSQRRFEVPANVRLYGEMPFRETLPYIKHASIGVAPYVPQGDASYLSESSLKLMQYDYLGLPSVCPHFAVRPGSLRHGYEPGNPQSIAEAIGEALAPAAGRQRPAMLDWEAMVARLLSPASFPDCELADDAVFAADPGPLLSLIVCTIGRTSELSRLFTSLAEQVERRFEVILVDQNPPGTLDAIVANFRGVLDIVHIQTPKGLSAGRNAGLKRARGLLVCFPDDDCWYPLSVTRDVTRFFSRYPNIDILLGRTVDAAGIDSLSQSRSRSGTVDKSNVWTSGNSNTMFFRRAASSTIGEFDETLGVGARSPFQSGEETDFLLRALSKKLRAIYLHQLVIHHDQVAQGRGRREIRRAWGYSMGFGRVLRMHRYGVGYVAYRVARSMARALASTVLADEHGARYRFAWAIGTLVGFFTPAG